EPKGIWARNHGHIMAGTSELVRECTTDFTGTDDGNRQRRFSCGSYIFHDDFSFDSFSSGQGLLSVDDVADPVQLKPEDCFLLLRGGLFGWPSDLSWASVDAATLFATTKNGTIASLNGGGDCFIVGAHFALAGNHAIILLGALPPVVHLGPDMPGTD